MKEQHRSKLEGYFQQVRTQQNREVRRTAGIRFFAADDVQKSEIHLTPPFHPGPQSSEALRPCTFANSWEVPFASIAQPTASSEWPTREDIFVRGNRRDGKEMLRRKYPSTLRDLEEGLRVIRSWLNNRHIDASIHAIVYRNYSEMPRMREVCMHFIRSKLHELPTLRFTRTNVNGEVVSSYSMDWDEYTVYDYIMDRRNYIRSCYGPGSFVYPDSMSVVY
ncbi:hypothetical protein R1sor_001035 [Riccia sorocarpa]|uniref:Uncharacterized protein n=1 Tax=Riccia sorocarpa TaxID=122646 RepID=A0ABD3GUV0_9MARC